MHVTRYTKYYAWWRYYDSRDIFLINRASYINTINHCKCKSRNEYVVMCDKIRILNYSLLDVYFMKMYKRMRKNGKIVWRGGAKRKGGKMIVCVYVCVEK